MPQATAAFQEPDQVLDVRGLSVEYLLGDRSRIEGLRALSLTVERGETVGILGESGSGKSTLAQAIAGLLPPNGRIRAGSITVCAHRTPVRGNEIALIAQDPMAALNPVLRVGTQIAEVLRVHDRNGSDRAGRVVHLLEEVGLRDARAIARRHPHQLSGGQAQRVVIAQALASSPRLLIADEPTASLDAIAQREIAELLRTLCANRETALILISHQPGVLAAVAKRVVVMFGGRIVEEGMLPAIFDRPMHPYTRSLIGVARHRRPADVVPCGDERSTTSCIYLDRCEDRVHRCASDEPELRMISDAGRRVACFRTESTA